jgi:phosphatidylglycerophosphate synthase
VAARSLSYLPNLLSSLRVALAPGMLGAAYSNSKTGFVLILVVLLLTDFADGWLARRLRAESSMGQLLDLWGDGLAMTLGAIGIYFLWPLEIEGEWPWALLLTAGYVIIGAGRLRRRFDRVAAPRWWQQTWAAIPPITVAALIYLQFPLPFRIVAALQIPMALLQLETGPALTGAQRTRGRLRVAS